MNMPDGTLCWIEIPAKDVAKVYDFYSKAFPEWEFTDALAKKDDGSYKPILIKFSSKSGMLLPVACISVVANRL